jgi:hypothetical protein
MGVVIFIRDGEGQDVKGSNRSLRLQREEGSIRPAVLRDILGVRKKDSLAKRCGSLIEEPIDRLESQVGHGRVIPVGIGQGDRKFPSPILEIGKGKDPMFLGKEVAGFFVEPSRHKNSFQLSAFSHQQTVSWSFAES